MSAARIIQGRGLVAGTVEGKALVSQEPVSFLGDVDITTGAIMGELPSMKGKRLGGSILVFPGSMGSAGAWRFIYQLFKHGTHPLALIAQTLPDPSVVQGAILAGIPTICEPDENVLKTIENGDGLSVDGEKGTVTVLG